MGNNLAFCTTGLLPTYYLADELIHTIQNLGTLGSNLLNIGIILGSSVILMAII